MGIRATIVCCYNKQSVFNKMLHSLKSQSEDVEVIEINNSDGKFSSCSAAFMLFFRIRTFYIIQSIAYQIFLTILRKLDLTI